MIKVNRSKLIYALIFILIMLDLDFFYLLDTNNISIFGVSYLDIVFLIHVGIFAVTCILDKTFLFIKVNKWNLIMCIPFVLAVLTSVAGILTYGQPFIKGFVSQREWLGCIVIFFSVSSWLNKGYINIEGLKKTIFRACTVMIVIYVMQYIVGNHFVFTHTMSSERYGGARYYFETAYLVLMAGVAVDNAIECVRYGRRKEFYKQVLFIAATLFVVAVVVKGRMLTLSVAISLLFCLLLLRIGKTKKIILLTGIVVASALFLTTDIASDAINTVQGVSSEYDTLSVRTAGRKYYMDLWSSNLSSILIGCGSPNLHWDYAQQITNPLWSNRGTARFYLVDNGIFGQIFIYGLCGLLWFISCVLLAFKTAYRIYKRSGKVGYFLFVMADVLACVTLVPNNFGGIIVFPLYMVLVQQEYAALIKDENKD